MKTKTLELISRIQKHGFTLDEALKLRRIERCNAGQKQNAETQTSIVLEALSATRKQVSLLWL